MNEQNREALIEAWRNPLRDELTRKGYRIAPARDNGTDPDTGKRQVKAAPFAKGENYGPKHTRWAAKNTLADAVALVLGPRVVCLDYDANKPGTISEAELRERVPELPANPHQLRESDGSAHYFFQMPQGAPLGRIKQNNVNAMGLQGVDVLTGNQVIYLKADKVQDFPPVEELPTLPAAVLAAMTRPEIPQETAYEPTDREEGSRYVIGALKLAIEAIRATESGRNNKLYSEARNLFRYAEGGYIDHKFVREALHVHGLAIGLAITEVTDTLKSAQDAARQDGPKHPKPSKKAERATLNGKKPAYQGGYVHATRPAAEPAQTTSPDQRTTGTDTSEKNQPETAGARLNAGTPNETLKGPNVADYEEMKPEIRAAVEHTARQTGKDSAEILRWLNERGESAFMGFYLAQPWAKKTKGPEAESKAQQQAPAAPQEPQEEPEPATVEPGGKEAPQVVTGELITAAQMQGRKVHHDDGMTNEGIASFLVASAGEKYAPFSAWCGLTGNEERDHNRGLIATAIRRHVRNIPPVVEAVRNKDGDITRFTSANHRDNYFWMCYRYGITVARNLLTFDFEAFDSRTNRRLTADEEMTLSDLIGHAAEQKLPPNLVASHMSAAAKYTEYHPISQLLHGKTWDGVQRVQRVIDCVPVKAEDEAHRNQLLTGIFLAAITALDEGSVSIKYVPVLYSKENDFYKTHFIKRIFDIMDGAFKEGVSIDPSHKDSVRKAVYCWGAELGELDSMTKKESGPLKAFIPLDVDEWRTEGVKTYIKKPRQTVFMGSVNKPKFLKDETMASRFPVIALTAPIKIDAVNQILGWRMRKDGPELVKRDDLIQFWLEVRAMRAAGATHVLDRDFLADMKGRNDQYIDRGGLRDSIVEAIEQHRTKGTGNPFTVDQRGDKFTVSEVARHFNIKIEGDKSEQIGKTLTRMAQDEELLIKRRTGRGYYYMINWPAFD